METEMATALHIDDDGSFNRMLEKARQETGYDESAAVKLVEERIVTAFVRRIREEARGKKDHLAALVSKKRRASNAQHEAKKPCSSSVNVNSYGSIKESEITAGCEQCFGNSYEDQQKKEKKKKMMKKKNKKKKLPKTPNSRERINIADMYVEPLEMPREWRDKIERKGGIDVNLVITKKVFTTDTNTHHDRLSIPVKQVRNSNFLTEEEKIKLSIHKDIIPVMLIEPCGFESNMWLRQWNLRNTSIYALTTSWNKVLERNLSDTENIREFKLNDTIQVWSFRVNGELWLALLKV